MSQPIRLPITCLVLLLVSGPPAAGQVRRQPPPGPGPAAEAGEEAGAATEGESTAEAEAGTGPDAAGDASTDPAGREDRSFNLLGDTSRFNRFSGWGGIGGTMGQWGMGRSMLINMPAVQEELGLTEAQKVLLREWSAQMRDRGREMAETMRPGRDGDGAGPGQGQGQGLGRGFPGAFDVMGMMGMMTQILQENEAGLARILDSAQRKRLGQITLQMEGASALARPEVAQAVGLLPVQVEAIQQIIAGSRTQQVVYWMRQGAAMWGDRNGRGGPPAPGAGGRTSPPANAAGSRQGRPEAPAPGPGPGPRSGAGSARGPRSEPAAGPAEGQGDREEPPAESRAEREARFRQGFETIRTGSDQIQDRTVQEVLKILTRPQRNRFDRLLGPPFDPNALTFGPPPADRPGPEGAEAAGTPRAVPRGPDPAPDATGPDQEPAAPR